MRMGPLLLFLSRAAEGWSSHAQPSVDGPARGARVFWPLGMAGRKGKREPASSRDLASGLSVGAPLRDRGPGRVPQLLHRRALLDVAVRAPLERGRAHAVDGEA